MKCTLRKTSKGGEAVRTDTVEGTTRLEEPVVGRPFQMTAPPLDPEMSMRLVTTSHVVEVEEYEPFDGTLFRIRTETGSVYDVEYI